MITSPAPTQADLARLVATASTLDERLAGGFQPAAHASGASLDKRFALWCHAVTHGDWDRFAQRLAWDGLDREQARAMLGTVTLAPDAPLPAWAQTLAATLERAAADPAPWQTAAPPRFVEADQPFPFEDLLIPFVEVAAARLSARGLAPDLLSAEAQAAFERNLLMHLSYQAANVLMLEFSLHKAAVERPLGAGANPAAAAEDADNRRVYREFVARLRAGRLLTLFQEYAGLARLLAVVTDLWVEATAEFIGRLAADLPAIGATFGGGVAPGQVQGVGLSISDQHRGRRTAIALQFASGLKLVYKPKDLAMEVACSRLIEWLNANGAPLDLRTFRVLYRETHGWVEFVEHESCADEAATHRYYRRAGMLLCLIYALDGTDCHAENIIAGGEYPVLIDMETLLTHRATSGGPAETAAHLLAYEQYDNSVMHTGMLPGWEVAGEGQVAFDFSGLGGAADQDLPVIETRWRNVNTDQMELEQSRRKSQLQQNIPLLDGAPLQLAAYASDILAGFEQMYRLLLARRDVLLAPGSPLHDLAQRRVRFVFRPSRIYGALLQQLRQPRYLRDGVERSLVMERLRWALISPDSPPPPPGQPPLFWPVLDAEQQALKRADVPFFVADTSRADLELEDGRRVRNCFVAPSFDYVCRRIARFSEPDLAQQLQYIQGALYALYARDPTSQAGALVEQAAGSEADSLATPDWMAWARRIAEEIAGRAVRAGDGSATWIAPQFLAQVERYQLQPMDFDLYDGTAGVALFLAALHSLEPGGVTGELALAALQPIRQALDYSPERLARMLGIGGASGLGSVVYALARAGAFLGDESLLADAARTARLITPERIAEDSLLDIIGGAAGTILGLLALHRLRPDAQLVEQARACGQHLLAARRAGADGHFAWATVGGRPATGFSHGAAGIAYSLLRLNAVAPNSALVEAAGQAFAYEDSLFSPAERNWPDLRTTPPSFMVSWCYGAPGIALSRQAALPVLDTPEIRRDLEIALDTTRQAPDQGVDHICCGAFGRADVLLEADHKLGRPELGDHARRMAGRVLSHAAEAGGFRLHPLLPQQIYAPGLFQGTAGIGYTLLRLAHPARLPSLLLWE